MGTIVLVKSAQAADYPDLSNFASDGWRFAAVVAAGVLCVAAPSFFRNYFKYRTNDRDSRRKSELDLAKLDIKLVNRTKKSKERPSNIDRMLRKIETNWENGAKKSKEANEPRSPKRRKKRGSDESNV